MAVTTSDLSDAVATALTSSATIDLGAFVDGLPSGTTADLEVRGTARVTNSSSDVTATGGSSRALGRPRS
ncbi:hypothetical protein ACFQHN_25595 [Natrialbaceae archaeon GCM10025896]